MSSSLNEDPSRDQILNRSCKQKVQDSSFHSETTPTIKFKPTRSQKQLKKQDQETGLEIMEQEWNRKQEKRKQHKKKDTQDRARQDINHQMQTQNTKRFKFGADLVQSEEITLYDDSVAEEQQPQTQKKSRKINNQQALLLQLRKSNSNMQNARFNIMTLGKSGIGKSSFIDCFGNKSYQSIPVIRGKTQFLNIVTVNSANLQINFFDLPGYEQVKVQQYIQQIQLLLNKKLQDHLSKISDKSTVRKGIVDERIHCCLFFLSGPWICEADWQIMKKIQNIVNIIPVIAKGDTYSTKQIKEFKKKVSQKNKQMNINWFSIEQILRQNHPQKLKQLLQGTFGNAPPFVITCCNQRQYNQQTGRYQLVRDFRWGKCELQNETHNDFQFLKSLLLFYLTDLLIKSTDISMRSFQQKIMQKQYPKPRDLQEISITQRNNLTLNLSSSKEIVQEDPFGFIKSYFPMILTGVAIIGYIFLAKRRE